MTNQIGGPIWKLLENALLHRIVFNTKAKKSLYEELQIYPSINLDTSYNISKQDRQGKRHLSKTYLIEIYMGDSWTGIVYDNKKT